MENCLIPDIKQLWIEQFSTGGFPLIWSLLKGQLKPSGGRKERKGLKVQEKSARFRQRRNKGRNYKQKKLSEISLAGIFL